MAYGAVIASLAVFATVRDGLFGVSDNPAIVAAATLSNRYITDRQLPDKAIDLMDEAASRIRMEVESKPEEIETLDRRILRLKIERGFVRAEDEPQPEPEPAMTAEEPSRPKRRGWWSQG